MISPNLFFLLYKVRLITGSMNLQSRRPGSDGSEDTPGLHLAYIGMGFERTEQSEIGEDKVLDRYGFKRDLLISLNTHAKKVGIPIDPYRDNQGSSPRWRRYSCACLADLNLSSPEFCEGSVWNQVIGGAAGDLAAEAAPILGPSLFTLISQSSLTSGEMPESWTPFSGNLALAFESAWSLPDSLTGAQGSALSFAPLVALAEQAVCGRVSEATHDPVRPQGCRL